jgi:uncharacterized membrane protein
MNPELSMKNPPSATPRRHRRIPSWRREALRTTLWVVPSVLAVAIGLLFVLTYQLDRAAYRGDITFPHWINHGSADAGRQILSAIAAADITVVGVVFSITIVALTLASQQFGPRMLRNFMRDRGTQYTLGTFVATCVYAVLALGSISTGAHGDFVPHLSIGVALALLLVDLGVLIYFIHHVAVSIQLPNVIAGIARDLREAIDAHFVPDAPTDPVDPADGPGTGASLAELLHRLSEEGAEVPATRSGYLQFIGRRRLVEMASQSDAVVRFLYHPGHFVVESRHLAVVWPADAAERIAAALDRAHAIGPQRTLTQDLLYAIDQLAEIALRALSPAVNDTFSALTCIDWLGDGLCRISARPTPSGVYRDSLGQIRLIEAVVSYPRIVKGAFDKIRQAGRGIPAVEIRQLDILAKIMEYTTAPEQRQVLVEQAEMIAQASEEAVPEERDRADVRSRFHAVLDAMTRRETAELVAG